MNGRSFHGIVFSRLDRSMLVQKFEHMLDSGRPHQIVTANPEMLLEARKNSELMETIRGAHLVTADGYGLFLWGYVPEAARITGNDLISMLGGLCSSRLIRVAVVGGKPGVAPRAARAFETLHPGCQAIGIDAGEVDSDGTSLDNSVIQEIRQAEPSILLVGLGHGKQERWIQRHLSDLPSVRIAVGVGGTIDFLAGDVRRAPKWLRDYGYEWLWRLLLQPWRIGRIFRAVFVFSAFAFWDRLRSLWQS